MTGFRSWIDWFRRIDGSYKWTIVGTLVGVIGLLYAAIPLPTLVGLGNRGPSYVTQKNVDLTPTADLYARDYVANLIKGTEVRVLERKKAYLVNDKYYIHACLVEVVSGPYKGEKGWVSELYLELK